MNLMKVTVHPGKVGLHPKIEIGGTYFIDRNSIWLGNEGNAYGCVYDINGNYLSDMSLKYFTSV